MRVPVPELSSMKSPDHAKTIGMQGRPRIRKQKMKRRRRMGDEDKYFE
jgi:hypothetical protein